MRLVTYGGDFSTALGVVVGEEIVKLSDPALPQDMATLIARWGGVKARVADLIDTGKERVPLNTVRLRQPILRPGKMLAIGRNYAEHAKETGSDIPDKQIWFCKHNNAANGPFDPVEIPRVSDQIDYEAELVVVIGTRSKHIAHKDALSLVFGYCCGNDVTVRDWQRMTPQWMLGKSFDTHAPFGPWITTADEIADPQALDIVCMVNGETRQFSNTGKMIFSIAEQIAWLSQAMTLEPGDLIFTGTPEGVAMGMKEPRWLRAGDTMRVEIAGLGAIENPLRAEA